MALCHPAHLTCRASSLSIHPQLQLEIGIFHKSASFLWHTGEVPLAIGT